MPDMMRFSNKKLLELLVATALGTGIIVYFTSTSRQQQSLVVDQKTQPEVNLLFLDT